MTEKNTIFYTLKETNTVEACQSIFSTIRDNCKNINCLCITSNPIQNRDIYFSIFPILFQINTFLIDKNTVESCYNTSFLIENQVKSNMINVLFIDQDLDMTFTENSIQKLFMKFNHIKYCFRKSFQTVTIKD